MPFFYKPYKNIQRSLQDRILSILKAQAIVIKKRFLNLILFILGSTRQNILGKIFCKKRAFRLASCPGIMTAEAAIAVPVFLWAAFALLEMVHMLGIHQELLTAMAGSSHISSVQGYDESFGTDQVLTQLVLQIGRSYVDFDRIRGGMAGIDYWGTGYDPENGDIFTKASCQLAPAFSMMGTGQVRVALTLHTRAFVGGKYLNGSSSSDDGDETVVYVAENGVVYHRSRECAYIDLSLHGVPFGQAASQRNAQGGRYYGCERCMGDEDPPVVYITDTGSRYHSTSQCGSLSRTVYEMVLTSDCVLPPCSRCGR